MKLRIQITNKDTDDIYHWDNCTMQWVDRQVAYNRKQMLQAYPNATNCFHEQKLMLKHFTTPTVVELTESDPSPE